MSAFVLPASHITALAVFAYRQGIVNATAQEIGALLHRENVRSICYRYPDDNAAEYGDFEICERAAFMNFSTAQILKAAGCYDYQACETPDWPQTPACKLVRLIEAKASELSGIPNDKRKYDSAEYEAAAWVIDALEMPALAA